MLFINTIKDLKPIQLRYQIRNRLPRWGDRGGAIAINEIEEIEWRATVDLHFSYETADHRFVFLNKPYAFGNSIDWNFSEFGKLWTYNLNYFDFLHQKEITRDEGLFLINNYVEKYDGLKDGKEPYPTSLRIINWIKFISRHHINDHRINAQLAIDLKRLENNLEYHLLANHLLENTFALLFGGIFFKVDSILKKASGLIREQLNEQILTDGAHFELSPMYHQLMLFRMLDSIQLLECSPEKDSDLLQFLRDKAEGMLGWLERMTFRNGEIPLLNDAAFGINPSTDELLIYGNALGIYPTKAALSTSGYRAVNTDKYELRLDVGEIGPRYQPGHAHADTFNFVLYATDLPFIIDTGTSTYEGGSVRDYERSTPAHNTITLMNENSSEVWSSFRVAKKAEVKILDKSLNEIRASHNGYNKFSTTHFRMWQWHEDRILIEDLLEGSVVEGKAFFHLHPDVQIIELGKDFVRTNLGEIIFRNARKIAVTDYLYAPEFNKHFEANKIMVQFETKLETTIKII